MTTGIVAPRLVCKKVVSCDVGKGAGKPDFDMVVCSSSSTSTTSWWIM